MGFSLKKLLTTSPVGVAAGAVKQIASTPPPQIKKAASAVRDVFDANTQADQQRRIAQGKPQMYRNEVAQRKGVLPMIYGRSQVFRQEAPKLSRSDWGNAINKAFGDASKNKFMNMQTSGNAGVVRAAGGLVQDAAGLYDLVTPGKGTNRVSQGAERFNKGVDNFVNTNKLNKGAYQSSQVASEVASFLVPGAVATKVSKAPRAAGLVYRGNALLNKAPRAAGIVRRAAPVATNIGADVLQGAARRTAKGEDNNIKNTGVDAGISLATAGAIAGGSKLVKKASDYATNPNRPSVGDLTNVMRYKQDRGSFVDDATHAARLESLRKFGIDPTSPESWTQIDRVLARQGGYVGLPGAGDTPAPAQVQTQKKPVGKKESYVIPEKAQATPIDVPSVKTAPDTAMAPQSIPEPKANPKTSTVKLNTNRLNMDGGYDAMKRLDDETRTTIETMSNKDIQRIAKDAGLDTKTNTPEAIKTKIAEQLNVRRDAVRLMNEAEAAKKSGDTTRAEELIKQAAEQGRISRQQGTELAQQLQARRIIANELDTPQQKIFKLLDAAGVNPDVYAKRLSNVDMNNANDVVKAYRDLVPAKASDWITAVRYNSMLSSPLTHGTNIMSNAVNVGVVAPVEKTVRGVLDGIGGLLGKERQYSAKEGLSYSKGALTSISKARDNFIDAMRGGNTGNLDLNEYDTPLAVGGAKGALDKTLNFPMRVLSATDGFFRALAEGGETAAIDTRSKAGIKVKGNAEALAKGEADYRLFQQDTNIKGQGWMLDSMDRLTNVIQNGRNQWKPLRWVLPFVKTPTNILKQSIEFSPAGFANAVTAQDKVTALTRAAIGTAIFGSAATMLESGEITWSEPVNPDEKAEFKASGKLPYSVKIGNSWVQMSKLPPAISFPFAITAAVNDAVENKKMDESTADAIFKGIAKSGQFLTDQSYLKSIGDTLKAIQSDPDKQVEALANYTQQLVPFRALMGWVARMTDDSERMVNQDEGIIAKQVEQLMMNIPGLRDNLQTRNYAGQPIQTNNPVLNAISPVKINDDRTVSNDNGAQKALLQMKDMQKQNDKKFKESFSKDEYDLYKLSTNDRQDALNSGTITQEQLDAVDRKALQAAKTLGIKPSGRGQATPDGIDATDDKVKSFYNDRAYVHDNDYKDWQSKAPDSDSGKDMLRRANQIRPEGFPELPNTNETAEAYAEFKREEANGGWTKLQANEKRKEFLRTVYRKQVTPDQKFIDDLGTNKLIGALESGEINPDQVLSMIGIDDTLIKLGATPMISKTIRRALGAGDPPSSSGGGGGGRSGGRGSKAKKVALVDTYTPYSRNRNALRSILKSAKL